METKNQAREQPAQINIPEQENALFLNSLLNQELLRIEYCGSSLGLGILDTYLKERATTFWFRDLMSSIAAITLGYFGYKTEASLRETFINNLKSVWQDFLDEEINKEALINKINEGIVQFSPRSETSPLSLRSILKNLLQELEEDNSLDEQNTTFTA